MEHVDFIDSTQNFRLDDMNMVIVCDLALNIHCSENMPRLVVVLNFK